MRTINTTTALLCVFLISYFILLKKNLISKSNYLRTETKEKTKNLVVINNIVKNKFNVRNLKMEKIKETYKEHSRQEKTVSPKASPRKINIKSKIMTIQLKPKKKETLSKDFKNKFLEINYKETESKSKSRSKNKETTFGNFMQKANKDRLRRIYEDKSFNFNDTSMYNKSRINTSIQSNQNKSFQPERTADKKHKKNKSINLPSSVLASDIKKVGETKVLNTSIGINQRRPKMLKKSIKEKLLEGTMSGKKKKAGNISFNY